MQIRERITIVHGSKVEPTSRTISAMPVVVSYYARIGLVEQFRFRDEAVFVLRVCGEDLKGRFLEYALDELDPYEVLREFQRVSTERQALDYLRHTGDFSPVKRWVSWSEFKRWQRFVEILQDTEALVQEQSHIWEPNRPHPEQREVIRVLGSKDHQFFIGSLHDEALAVNESTGKVVLIEESDNGWEVRAKKQRQLETYFLAPPVTIRWWPKPSFKVNPATVTYAGGLPEFLAPQGEQVPKMFIESSTSLEAIAGALYADRVAQVTKRICQNENCRKTYEPKSPQQTKFCSSRCSEATKQRHRRAHKRAKGDNNAEAEG